ncbi:MAG: MgtC/SapB transporter, partial [Deltaproteobacteria bacterium]|nr:MgtC/SapB transporter [Deltaproteobacteria bacterium]
IIREKYSVRGLTTAACLWIAAAIGVACGVGLFGISIVVAILSLLSLLLLKKVELRLTRDTYIYLRLWCEDRPGITTLIDAGLESCNIHPLHASIEKNISAAELHLMYQVRHSSRDLSKGPVETLAAIPGMKRVSMGWE